MKTFLSSLCIFFSSVAVCESGLQQFVTGSRFENICSQTVLSKSGKSTNSHRINRPAFAISKKYFYAALEEYHEGSLYSSVYRAVKAGRGGLKKIFMSRQKIRDVLYLNREVWALQNHRILIMSDDGSNPREIPLGNTAEKRYQHGYDMAVVGPYVVVSYGQAGLILINKSEMTVEKAIDLGLRRRRGHLSLATSLAALNETTVIVGVDNATMAKRGRRPFNGLIEVDILAMTSRRYPYNVEISGMLSKNSKMQVKDRFLWINNWGNIQFLDLDAMRAGNEAKIGWIPTTYNQNGKKWSAQPSGEFLLVGGDMFVCAKRSMLQTTKRSTPKGMVYRIPEIASKATSVETAIYWRFDIQDSAHP